MSGKPLETATAKKFTGHLGQLTPQQETILQDFKSILEKAQLYKPATGSSAASHDDATLLRFLRARRFDPRKAHKQFSETAAWRKQHDVDNLFANFDLEEFESTRRFYPRWTGRRDRQGIPVFVYRLAALSENIQEEITSVPQERRYHRIIVLYEALTYFIFPLCSDLPRAIAPMPVSATTSIIDLADTSLRQLWALRTHLQDASVLATANYPETLGTIVVVNAPAFFPTIWSWVKNWFDENTRDKIHILGKNMGASIHTLVDPRDLPRQYGGELEWVFEDPPALDDDARAVLGDAGMPRGPVVFVDGRVVPAKEVIGNFYEQVRPQKMTDIPIAVAVKEVKDS